MANYGNEIVDSDTNCPEQMDRFDYNNPNATDKGPSTSETSKFFPKILKYLMRSTVRIIPSKKKKLNTKRKRKVSMLWKKSEEKMTKCTSLSSIVDKIKPNAETAVNIECKKKLIDAVTSTTRSGEVLDKVTRENLLDIVGHLVRNVSHRYAKNTAKDVNKDVQERGCGPLCVGIGTQSDTDREFSLRTSPDAFAEACEERRHADFILEEIAKMSDALTEKTRLVSVREQTSSILASISVTSSGYELEQEKFENMKRLKSPIIHTKEKPTTVCTTDTLAVPSNDFVLDSQISTNLDKSLSTSDIQVIPSLPLRQIEPTAPVMYTERDDFRDTEVTTKIVREETKEEQEPPLDKHVDEADYAAANSVVISYVPKLKRTISKRKIVTVKDGTDFKTLPKKEKAKQINRQIEDKQVDKRKIPTIKDTLPKSVSLDYKKPKYRAKYRFDAPHKNKEETVSKKVWIPKNTDKISPYRYISLPSPIPIKRCRSSDYFKRPAMETYQDCRSKPLRCLQLIIHCENLILSNICLGRTKQYCGLWTVPCFNSLNGLTRNATYYRSPQDSCGIKNRASCHSLINDCAKPRVTFGNSLCTNTYCKNDIKHYPQLNNIDNVRMGYCRCNDSCPVWDNNQHCGRDRSYYWKQREIYISRIHGHRNICCDIIDIDNGNI